MRKLVSISLLLCCVSCENGLGPDPGKKADEHNHAKFSQPDKEAVAHYMVELSSFCNQEITLCKLAQENSINKEIQSTGKVLETDYINLLSEIRDRCKEMVITIPEEPTNDQKKKNAKTRFEIADDFDRIFLESSIDDHRKMLEVKCKLGDKTTRLFCEEIRSRLRRNLDFILIKHYDRIHQLS